VIAMRAQCSVVDNSDSCCNPRTPEDDISLVLLGNGV